MIELWSRKSCFSFLLDLQYLLYFLYIELDTVKSLELKHLKSQLDVLQESDRNTKEPCIRISL